MCHPEVPAGQVTPNVSRQEVQVPVAGGESLPALLTRPESGEGPAVLIVADIYGRSPFYEDLAARVAQAGFVGLLPEYFFRQGPLAERSQQLAFARRGQLDENLTLRDLGASIDWLKGQTGVRGDRTGTVGFCMGGTLVLDLAAERGDLATVCYYGFPAGVPNGGPKSAPAPLDLADRLQGPILGFWGDGDTNVGMDNVAKLAAALGGRGANFEHTVYPGLGHGFLGASRFDPDHEAYAMACDSWTRALGFYRQHLGAAVAA